MPTSPPPRKRYAVFYLGDVAGMRCNFNTLKAARRYASAHAANDPAARAWDRKEQRWVKL